MGVNHDDAIEGTVLLQRGEQSIPALKQLDQKVKDLQNGDFGILVDAAVQVAIGGMGPRRFSRVTGALTS